MPQHRRKNLLSNRRRLDEEGEEDGSIATEHIDDTASETSVPSDVDQDAEADDSDLSDSQGGEKLSKSRSKGHNATSKRTKASRHEDGAVQPVQGAAAMPVFGQTADMEAMMNGLRVSEDSTQEGSIEFHAAATDSAPGNAPQPADPQTTTGWQETMAERRRREQEEYNAKKASDPAFIPNRGAFFMHDHRLAASGQPGLRPFGRGRGRGRIGGPFAPSNFAAQPPNPTDSAWKHDLHETLDQPAPKPQSNPHQGPPPHLAPAETAAQPPTTVPTISNAPPAPVNRTFSQTVQIGNVQVQVFIPGMKAPIVFSGVPVKSHTRLPNHRPPLRRDKPVRVSLPDHPPRYIFPSTDRSFIFIPRALRPNQQGFGRGRGRGPIGPIGGYSSRRTSAYGGSVYSPSITMSRRSSLAREIGRESVASPTGSVLSRQSVAGYNNRPVVRLPGSQQHTPTVSGTGTPVIGMPPPVPYSLPQKPYREQWQPPITMHQPRPQKTVSVAGIESPASVSGAMQSVAQHEQQPFHQQVPGHVNGAAPSNVHAMPQPDLSGQYYNPLVRQPSYPNSQSAGTPLSNIPERAIHAPAFQPYPQSFQQPYAAPPGYYYPQQGQSQYTAALPNGAVIAPIFVPNGQSGTIVVPTIAAAPPQVGQAANQPPNGQVGSPSVASAAGMQPAQASMVAQEANGMVYYYDPNQYYQPMQGGETYQSPMAEQIPMGQYGPGYTVPGMGGMMTPSPDGYYYPQMGSVPGYYPQQ